MIVHNKLKCLSRASLSSRVYCLQVRLELTQLKQILNALIYGSFLALPTNINLGQKGLQGTDTPAYYEHF
jgi:hypothetical protein